MSGTQSAASDRFHSRKPTRHGSILYRESSTDKKQKVERSVSSSHDFDATESVSRKAKSTWDESRQETYGLVQRCVVIQRDENGFGLTVSGDNPVFVQSVKEDGAAMRAGVQTGDRIIKVNGTLVTHSNHLEVVKLIKSGSYVALTVQGRPLGSPTIPLTDSEADNFVPIMPPHSPVPQGHGKGITSPILMEEENNIVHTQKLDILMKMLQKEQDQLHQFQEEFHTTPSQRLSKEIQDSKKHIAQLQDGLSKARGLSQGSESLQISELDADSSDILGQTDCSSGDGSRPNSDIVDSPRSGQRDKSFLEESLEKSEIQDTDSQSSMGSPSIRFTHNIIGAEDDDFDAEPEQSPQINGQCSCFQNMDLLKSHPAHLAVFIHHVVSQFDPAALLCYLHADLYQQTNSKETRRVFMEFNQFFLERAANLKVPVPDDVALELEKRRPELIPEELHRQYIQTVQERLSEDVKKNLEDFKQKRSMGLTLAEGELSKLDTERFRDRNTIDKERACAEQIVQKIEEILFTSQTPEDEKSNTIQYVILTYMKHLGVKVKEPRSLEQKRGRIGFLPKIKQSMKKDREGEEKVKRRGFPSILAPQRKPSRQDSNAIGKAMELQRQRHPKHLSTSSSSSPEPADGSRLRTSGGSIEGSDTPFSPSSNLGAAYTFQEVGREVEGVSRCGGENMSSVDTLDGGTRTSGPIFDFPSPSLDHLHEEIGEADRLTDLGTPKLLRKLDSVALSDIQSEDEHHEIDQEEHPPNWQQLVSKDTLQKLKPHEIKQQEVINELFCTERAHVQKLSVLDQVFHQRVIRENLLTPAETRNIFSNLEEILQLHGALNEQMKAVKKRYETSVVEEIGDYVLNWFSGAEEEKLKQAVATFCSNQPFALEMIKSRQKKDLKFLAFVQDAESNPLCKRLQLKDIIPTEMQRLTKYPLLLDNIARYSDQEDEKEKVNKAANHCRNILDYVNQAVKEAENKQRLEDYQRRLDLSCLKPGEYPMIDELRNLDLTKRKLIHEGPLTWKVNKDKSIDLYSLLLEDILVLLQRQDDKFNSEMRKQDLAATSESKHIFSPVIKLNTVLVRQVATDNKAFFVISMSENGAQIYELMANSVSEKNGWQDLITSMAATSKTENSQPAQLQQTDPDLDSEEEHEDQLKLSNDKEDERLLHRHRTDKDTESLVQPKSFSPSPTHGSILPHHAGILKDQNQQDFRCSTSPSSCHPSTEHHLAVHALRNLGLLKQLLEQQLKFLQKEEEENFQRFCSHKTKEQNLTRVSSLNKQNRGSRESDLNKDLHALHRAIDKGSEHGNTGPDCVAEILEESGEQFFDAQEPHSDIYVDGSRREKHIEEAQFRSSENYLILDGYENVPESSTDDDLSASHYSNQGDPNDSLHGEERLAFNALEPASSSEAFDQMLHYIETIESDLQQLKGLEDHYITYRNRVALSGVLEEDPDKAMLPTDKG
ncbi:Rho guanine nucleotide exchange factor 12 S homeolog [Xenopus laevis]|uniref:Guanine nucleotide exchange factor n=1 Tax=Xenopus laevis TaxID=8355 RepID=Q6XS95_XENLA|nr:Rho guanine nucleotide exchange factor 12 S homeolog [Xenopus laevis]AAP43996.1 guanine nucleotide exchange factor [Xenopus laevis]